MVVDVGSGPAFVLIPGIQGRWEWMKPTVEALATRWRVLSGSLPSGEFDEYLDYVDRLLESAQVRSAVICGVSFGGLVALRYAARRGARVRALILVSAPGPRWHVSAYQAKYLRWPVILSPLFMIGALQRTWRELSVTFPDFGTRLSFCGRWAFRVASAPVPPWQMARRARLALDEHFDADCARISVPTLVVAGEHDLDRVVNPEQTMSYLTAIDRAEFRLFERTGHLGTVTAPDRFAAIVSSFASRLPEMKCQTTSAS